MTVPVPGTIRLVNGRITEKVAAEIGERLIALEKALQDRQRRLPGLPRQVK